jgi:anionic cell wall polymer biosynthesis LytR-Cps2A-Psr (LCP) family protein
MVNSLGGVPVNIPQNLNDRNSRAKGIRKGLHTLNGHDALAFSRDRHDFGRGDFERTVHQGQVMLGGLTKARQLVAKDPGKTLGFLRTVFKETHNDIPLLEAFRLGLLMLQIKPADVTNTFLDGTDSVDLFDPRPLLNNVADDAIIN